MRIINDHTSVLLASGAAGFVVGSWIEYWVHRYMHHRPKSSLGQVHKGHHLAGTGKGVFWEFLGYLKGAYPPFLLPALLLGSPWEVRLGWSVGGFVYMMFAAYAHQLMHENPCRVWWMKMPVHYVHHKYGMWHHNYGLAVDWWDHLFGTYQGVPDWCTEKELEIARRCNMWQIKWI